jgi:hypothetical protein
MEKRSAPQERLSAIIGYLRSAACPLMLCVLNLNYFFRVQTSRWIEKSHEDLSHEILNFCPIANPLLK